MSWAVKRQILILLIIVVFLAGFTALFFYVTKPTLSCFDKIQNQKEEGVDCGGPCDLVCPNSVSDPIVEWSRVLAVRQGQFDVVAYIENPNPGVGLRTISYSFRLYDAQNKSVAERTGTTYINPGEKFIIYEPNVNTGKAIPVKAYVEFEKPDAGYAWIKVKKKTTEIPNLSVRTKQFDEKSGMRATATIANDALTDGRNIQITTVLYDSAENVIGASSTFLDTVKGASEVPVVFTWPNPFETPPASFEMYLHYDQGIGAAQ